MYAEPQGEALLAMATLNGKIIGFLMNGCINKTTKATTLLLNLPFTVNEA
jgi:hypothetical protein